MTVCDACGKLATNRVGIKIDTKKREDCSETSFDFCDVCAVQASHIAFRVGVIELVKNAVPKGS